MRIKLGLLLLAGVLIALAAWLVRTPEAVHADEVPVQYRDTVARGLEFLAKSQHKDGHWEGADGKHPVAVTALAGMAFLMEGSTVHKGTYSENLRKAVDWLLDQSQEKRGGLIYSGHPSEADCYMEGHGLAMQFFVWRDRNVNWVPDLPKDASKEVKARAEKFTTVLPRAYAYIAKAQSSRGGWYKTSKTEGHDFDAIVPTAIQVQALYMASERNLGIGSESIGARGQDYLKDAFEKLTRDKKVRAPELAAALVCRCSPEAHLDQDGLSTAWAKQCRTAIPLGGDVKFGRDEFMHLQYAQALYTLHKNGEFNASKEAMTWLDYRKAMFDHLQKTQNKDGSWPGPVDVKDAISVGPVYTTAVWCNVLQFDSGRHPLTHRRIEIRF